MEKVKVLSFKELPNKIYMLKWSIDKVEHTKLHTKSSLLKLCNGSRVYDELKQFAIKLFEEGKIK